MAFGRYVSVEVIATEMGSYLEANYPEAKLADVEPVYSGTTGSVVLLINR